MQAIKSNALLIEGLAEKDKVKADVSKKYANIHNDRSKNYQDAQEILLFLGVVLYIGGHIWHLAEMPEAVAPKEPAVTHSPAAITATAAPAHEQQDIPQRPAHGLSRAIG